MSYRPPLTSVYPRASRPRPVSGLGQAKWVPGQLSFQALPPGVTAPPDFQRLREAGLPIAPYIEHGSWVTGEPDIMRYGRDPYRGIMGLGMAPPGNRRGLRRRARRAGLADNGDGMGGIFDGLWAFLGRLFGGGGTPAASTAATPTATATEGSVRAPSAAIMSAVARSAGRSGDVVGAVGSGTVEAGGRTVYTGDAQTAMAFARTYSVQNHVVTTVRVANVPTGRAGARANQTLYVTATGEMTQTAPSGTSGLGALPPAGTMLGAAALGALAAAAMKQNAVAGGLLGMGVAAIVRPA